MPVVALPVGLVPAAGALRITATLPVSWPLDTPLYAQLGTIEPNGSRAWLSNSLVVLVRSP